MTSEHELIRLIQQWTDSPFIGDDCAVLPDGLLITSDSLVEGTHFRLDWTSLVDLGWKACAVNLSDIAAMAGRPKYLSVSLTVPRGMQTEQFRQFYQGFTDCAKSYKAQIVGGDLTTGEQLVIAINAFGAQHEKGCLKRSGAKPGDVVVTTGDYGASAAALALLQRGIKPAADFRHCSEKHFRPMPRLCESWSLVRRVGDQGALMDTSDGLADALLQIARSSGVAIELDLDAVPVHADTKKAAAKLDADLANLVLYGGEDYELVATLSEGVWNSWNADDENPFQKIGVVKSGNNVTLKSSGGQTLAVDLSKCFQQIDLE